MFEKLEKIEFYIENELVIKEDDLENFCDDAFGNLKKNKKTKIERILR